MRSCLALLLILSPVVAQAELSEEERSEGFVSLFDGHSLDGWMGAVDGYTAADGVRLAVVNPAGEAVPDDKVFLALALVVGD